MVPQWVHRCLVQRVREKISQVGSTGNAAADVDQGEYMQKCDVCVCLCANWFCSMIAEVCGEYERLFSLLTQTLNSTYNKHLWVIIITMVRSMALPASGESSLECLEKDNPYRFNYTLTTPNQAAVVWLSRVSLQRIKPNKSLERDSLHRTILKYIIIFKTTLVWNKYQIYISKQVYGICFCHAKLSE